MAAPTSVGAVGADWARTTMRARSARKRSSERSNGRRTIGKDEERDMGPVYGVEDYVVVTSDGADVFPGYPKEQRILGA